MAKRNEPFPQHEGNGGRLVKVTETIFAADSASSLNFQLVAAKVTTRPVAVAPTTKAASATAKPKDGT